jgi:HEAT repeat protein
MNDDDAAPDTDRMFPRWHKLTLKGAIAQLENEEPRRRFDAAVALGSIRATSAIGPLREAKILEDDLTVRTAITSALERITGEWPGKESVWTHDPYGDE